MFVLYARLMPFVSPSTSDVPLSTYSQPHPMTLTRCAVARVHQVVDRAGGDDVEPLKLAGGIAIHPSFLRAKPMPSLANLWLLPMLVLVPEKDMLIDTELEHCEAMKEARKEVEVLINEGMTHSFYLNKAAVEMDEVTADQAEKLILEIISFINKH
ncbi:hypothetical protein GH714_013461 [Hevea brasiliensis]|uniref:Alpha/beta hydrolase fold-3 domain-containing protein n=1 Tax=Hevea brasiliensis TaxID=3981 RepID=A0A6A6KLI9_HEVBR|nr:hypothetical protein GH714_013461 [Hevea brasiliensis]